MKIFDNLNLWETNSKLFKVVLIVCGSTSFLKPKNSVFSLFVMTCPLTPHRSYIEEFWVGISKAQNVKDYRFEALKPPKMVLTSPKWPRNIQVTILNPYGNFIFEIQKSKIPVRYRGLSPLPWTPPYGGKGKLIKFSNRYNVAERAQKQKNQKTNISKIR